MRIVGGRWAGRRIQAPQGSRTRPTSDRVREALFSIVMSRFPDVLIGGIVLDAFTGSGALAFEALSRGADMALMVDDDPSALAVARSNADSLGADTARIRDGNVFTMAREARIDGGPFTLLFMDPPYRIERAQVRDLLDDLATTGSLAEDAVVVYEHGSSVSTLWPSGFETVLERTYGDTGVSVAVYMRGD